MSSIAIDIMTPERLVLQTQAESVVVPAADGELGILCRIMRRCWRSCSRVKFACARAVKTWNFFAVSGGFVEVENNKISIFAETAEMAHEIDVERARQAAERAERKLKVARTDVDLAQAEAALRRALVRLHVAEGHLGTVCGSVVTSPRLQIISTFRLKLLC